MLCRQGTVQSEVPSLYMADVQHYLLDLHSLLASEPSTSANRQGEALYAT